MIKNKWSDIRKKEYSDRMRGEKNPNYKHSHRTCSVPNCKEKYYAKNLCRRHYHQQFYFGEVRRTFLDKNEFLTEGEITQIFLYNGKQEIVAKALIDSEDYEKCKSVKWTGRKEIYGLRVFNNKIGQLSEFIMNFKSTAMVVIDHINGNTLDNRKQNLQICTTRQNQMKKRMQKNNTSGYRGVCWNKNQHKWQGAIVYKRKHFHLGLFSTKEEAALAYNKKAKELFGEFAVLNSVGI